MIGFVATILIGALSVAHVMRSGKRLRRRFAIGVITLALVGSVTFQAEHYAKSTAEGRAQDVVHGCATIGGAEIDLGPFPASLRALRGRFDDVRFRADIVEIADLRLQDLDVEVQRVRFRPLGSLEDIDIDRAEGSVRIRQGALDRLLVALGVPATAIIERDGIVLRLPPGIDLNIAIEVKDGRAIVTVPGLSGVVGGVELSIPGVNIESVEATPGALRARLTATGRPRDLVCDAGATLEQALRPLSLIAHLNPEESSSSVRPGP